MVKTKTGKRLEKRRDGKTQKRRYATNKEKSHIVRMFLEMLNVVKLYHWRTYSFSQHRATDELYSRLNKHIDDFVEVLLGKEQSRIQMVEREIRLMDPSNRKDFQSQVFVYRTFLTDLNIYFDSSRDSDLLNIRDEILGDINQFLYLLTFDK